MKKIGIFIGIIATLLFTSTASATLYNYYNAQGLKLPSIEERKPLADSCGIDNYVGSISQNMALEACLEFRDAEMYIPEVLGVNQLPVDGYDDNLSAPLNSTATTIYVNNLPSNVTSSIYTIFGSDGRTVSEKVACTGKSTSPNKLTGCTRGLSTSPNSDGSIDETAGTGTSHSKNARIAITDNINFSGKALAILNGSQKTDANNFDIGTASSTDGNKCLRFDNSDTNGQICRDDGTGDLYWTLDGGSNTYNFASSTFSQLTASSTAGIGILGSEVYINASSTTGMGFDSNGALYQAIGNALEYTGNTINISTTTLVNGGVATNTPSAGLIPLSNASSTLDSWVTQRFGGDGSDGAFSTTTAAVIDLAGEKLVVKNYTSISITGTGSLSFTNPNANGTIVILRSQGDVTITCSSAPCIDMRGIGASGGGTATPTNGLIGNGILTPTIAHYGNAASGGTGGVAGIIVPSSTPYLVDAMGLYSRSYFLAVGSGGGSGVNNSGADSAGGRGGGSVLLEVRGSLNFTTTNGINCSGSAGSNAAGTDIGGGGGGSAGMCAIIYGSLTSSSGTILSAGGAGGTGGDLSAGTCGGGGGAGSIYSAGGTGGNTGSNGGSASGLGAGGGGGGCKSSGSTGGAGGGSIGGYIAKNILYF